MVEVVLGDVKVVGLCVVDADVSGVLVVVGVGCVNLLDVIVAVGKLLLCSGVIEWLVMPDTCEVVTE